MFRLHQLALCIAIGAGLGLVELMTLCQALTRKMLIGLFFFCRHFDQRPDRLWLWSHTLNNALPISSNIYILWLYYYINRTGNLLVGS